ncbi:nitrite reductase/ring-hydroxylating ferredoxin subunit [Bradyrhizobium elkanii]|uniref:Rieske 2Fe-2S domain-containing protein n=1 Tax=Bradyrhizobium elkanii TaxID=29448 RepID=UPI003511AF6B
MTDDQGTWHEAAALSALNEGEPYGIEIGRHHVALYRVGNEYYATSNICTHAEALLSDGILEGCEIECPLHMGPLRYPHRRGADQSGRDRHPDLSGTRGGRQARSLPARIGRPSKIKNRGKQG